MLRALATAIDTGLNRLWPLQTPPDLPDCDCELGPSTDLDGLSPKVLRAAAIQLTEWAAHQDCPVPFYCRALARQLTTPART